jgi:hypothetical protein
MCNLFSIPESQSSGLASMQEGPTRFGGTETRLIYETIRYEKFEVSVKKLAFLVTYYT